MGDEFFHSRVKKPVNSRLCKVSGYTTELLEILSDDPKLHLLSSLEIQVLLHTTRNFWKHFELLGGIASITAIGHIPHSKKDWEAGRLFSLHKVDFIREEMPNLGVPVILVGHSIGAFIAVEMLKRSQEKVNSCDVLYIAISDFDIKPEINIAGNHYDYSRYHIVRYSLFMSMQEFEKLSETPDWEFMRENKGKIASLFGVDAIRGPLHVYEEMSKQVPGISLAIEREGHTHYFSCSEAGSVWVASHVTGLIKTQVSAVE